MVNVTSFLCRQVSSVYDKWMENLLTWHKDILEYNTDSDIIKSCHSIDGKKLILVDFHFKYSSLLGY